jgi:hypothetical protein
MPKLNVPLLREIQKQILREPNGFFMRSWIRRRSHDNEEFFSGDIVAGGSDLQRFPECGTAACIGGWAVLLSGGTYNENVEPIAKSLLGLSSTWLFQVSTWDRDLQGKYWSEPSVECRAAIAAEQIERVIQRYGEKESESEKVTKCEAT